MRLLYISVHETLEHDELTLFTEMGIDCFSLGAYSYPEGHPLLKRPGIPGMKFDQELAEWSRTFPKTNIPKEFLDNFDAIMVMHDPNVIVENWDKFKDKKVIWRTIGQSTSSIENMVRRMRYDGMKIVRMSPQEDNIIGNLGSDALIRFYKDPNEWKGWTGHEKRVINFTQSLKGRRIFCHYDQIMPILNGFPSLIYGSGNEDLGSLNGGELPYDLMKGALRDNRVFVYAGTWPSPYTLSNIEAQMTGIPVVAIGPSMAQDIEISRDDKFNYYEMDKIITNGEDGFISDDLNELRGYVHELLENPELAKKIGDAGRKRAIELFGKETIKKQWEDFFKTLND